MTTSRNHRDSRVALVTGGSRGLGHALITGLTQRGWHVVTDARDASRLRSAFQSAPHVTAIAGDVADAGHRSALAAAVRAYGRLDLIVNNASVLGPLTTVDVLPLSAVRSVFEVNVFGPLSLYQLVQDVLDGVVINVSSDAACEPYETWSGYGSAKAALDQITAVLGRERTDLRVYSFDPGDMATDLQQQAFPDDDVSDRPSPESVVPSLLRLVEGLLPSGRYTAADLLASVPA